MGKQYKFLFKNLLYTIFTTIFTPYNTRHKIYKNILLKSKLHRLSKCPVYSGAFLFLLILFMFKIKSLYKSYNQTPIVKDISMEILAGETIALVGESGAGKSTLLQMMALLLEPDSGDVCLEDKNLNFFAKHLIKGYPSIKLVPQDYRLFPNISIKENIAYALKDYTADYKAQRTEELLLLCGLNHVAKHLPKEVSGGEKQRTAIARAIADEPKVLLLDEPFSNLDTLHKQQLKQTIQTLVKQENIACVFVTHDLIDAISIADKIGMLKDGEMIQLGRFEELLLQPASPYIQTFLTTTIDSIAEVMARIPKDYR
jgi:ABC-type sugar transport system ATPase subunit